MATNFITYSSECREIASRDYGFGRETSDWLGTETAFNLVFALAGRLGIEPRIDLSRKSGEVGRMRDYGFDVESIRQLNFESDYREGLSPSQAVDRAATEIGNWFYNHMVKKF